MFEKLCVYCHKPIKKEDYLVHIRYQKFDGTHNEYFHLQCYDKMNKEHAEAVRAAFKRLLDSWENIKRKNKLKYTFLDNIRLPHAARCTVCGKVLKAKTYDTLIRKLDLHAQKCFEKKNRDEKNGNARRN